MTLFVTRYRSQKDQIFKDSLRVVAECSVAIQIITLQLQQQNVKQKVQTSTNDKNDYFQKCHCMENASKIGQAKKMPE